MLVLGVIASLGVVATLFLRFGSLVNDPLAGRLTELDTLLPEDTGWRPDCYKFKICTTLTAHASQKLARQKYLSELGN